MAISKKDSADKFPLWKPNRFTVSLFEHNFRTRYKALRNSSSGFIKRNDVRLAIMNKSENKCSLCGLTYNLQVDHIVSVYKCAMGIIDIKYINSYDNLRILCSSCNVRRVPNAKM
jgi:5-methylcytosine-specific restriction endonuclease McrA